MFRRASNRVPHHPKGGLYSNEAVTDMSFPPDHRSAGDLDCSQRGRADDVAWRTFIGNARAQGPWPLSDDHFSVVRFVLEYHRLSGEAPALVRVARATGLSSKKLHALFPFGVARTIFQLAGLPLPPDMIGCCPPLSRLDTH